MVVLRGRLSEGCRAMSAVLAVVGEAAELHVLRDAFTLLNGTRPESPPTADPPVVDTLRSGRAVWLYAYGLYYLGEMAGSRATNARALSLFTAADDLWGIAAATGLRSMHALLQGDLAGVEREIGRSAEIFRELGDRWGELQATVPLSGLAEIRGDYAEAERLREEGLRIAEKLGLAADLAISYCGLGRLALLARDWERGHELHERARRLASEQGNVYVQCLAVIGFALGARRSGDLDAAETYLACLFDHYPSSEVGDHLLWAELGFTAELRGDEALATERHLRALELACSMEEPRAMALTFEGLAGAAALSKDPRRAGRAARLLGAADATRRGGGSAASRRAG
ncbi:hypothetical protein ACFQYP_32540 [Nonomuraea antimicrobica]